MEMLESKPGVIFGVIRETASDPKNKLPVSRLCEAAGVSKSGYYRWLSHEQTRAAREARDEADFALVKEAFEYKGYDKGVRGICMRLERMKHPMNPKKIRRLMRKYGLRCPIRKANPYRRMAKAMKTDNYAKNVLERNFTGLGPRKALLTDITYIPFKGHFIYVSPVIDACTKEALAHRASTSLQVDFVIAMLGDLERDHGHELSPDTLIHSDQGCHYTSKIFIETAEAMELVRSMSRRGNCWDNAPQESFFGHMKDEIGDKIAACETDEEAFAVIDEWFDYYNNDRPIWGLRRMTPVEAYGHFLATGEIVVPKKYPKKRKAA
jgi:transposase InsO family protein